MPKNNKKRGGQRKGAGGAGPGGPPPSHPPTDEENSVAGDNWSTASVVSDNSSVYDGLSGLSGEDPQETEDVEEQNFEDRMLDAIEGLTVKSAPQRKKFMESLKQGLCKKYCAEFLQKRAETITDSLLRSLKKGKAEEQTLAAQCLGLLALQLGADFTPVYQEVQTTLSTFLSDNSAPGPTRAQCASTMALCCFVHAITTDDDITELSDRMTLVETVLKSSSGGKDGSGSSELSEMNVSCVDAWCLLLTRAPGFFVQDKAQSHMSLLGRLLLSSDTELRIAAGMAIALLYEMNRDIDEDFDEGAEDTELLCGQLKELSTENTKHKTRIAMREQRARFRDILQTVQDGEFEETLIKIGSKESLLLEDWSARVQYNAFCRSLTSGILLHLQENVMLRDFFDLGAPIPTGGKPVRKMTKVQRNYYNSQAEKARTMSRAKHRDKRSSVVGY